MFFFWLMAFLAFLEYPSWPLATLLLSPLAIWLLWRFNKLVQP